MNTEPHQKWSSRNAAERPGPARRPTPAVAAQMPIAIARSRVSVKTLVSSESVAGMMNAAPAPITARAITSWLDATGEGGRRGRGAEHREAEQQRAAPPVAVTERAREQQAVRRTPACRRRPPTGAG